MKPKRLRDGDTVAIIAPASHYAKKDYNRIKNNILQLNLKPVFLPSCYASHGYFAGNDQQRLNDIHEAFSNDDYQGIICLKGGYGTPRLLDQIDFELIQKHPKVFLGYSDITGLHAPLNNLGMVTFHGPMASSELNDDFTISSMVNAMKSLSKLKLSNPANEVIHVHVQGQCTGPIVGGNLSLLTATLGSPYEINTKGKILFIEEVNEKIYAVDRMLTSLHLAGKFKDAVGIILGTFTGCVSERKSSLTLEQVIHEIIVPYDKPTISNFRAGHNFPQQTIPFNVPAVLNTDLEYIELLESGVRE